MTEVNKMRDEYAPNVTHKLNRKIPPDILFDSKKLDKTTQDSI